MKHGMDNHSYMGKEETCFCALLRLCGQGLRAKGTQWSTPHAGMATTASGWLELLARQARSMPLTSRYPTFSDAACCTRPACCPSRQGHMAAQSMLACTWHLFRVNESHRRMSHGC